MKRKPLVRLGDVLPATSMLPAEVPKLEHEPLHKKVQRLNAEQERLTAEIQDHRAKWADRNRLAQATRQPPSTPEITAFKTYHRELSSKLAEVNLQIGIANKEVRAKRADKAARQGAQRPPDRVNGSGPKKTCPLKAHPQWDLYWRLACENQLAPALLKSIEAEAKGLLSQALKTEIEQ